MPQPLITLIAARARNGVIGQNNALPWHLPEDLKHFRQQTMGHTVLLGRKTWESIGRPLPGRQMVVISRQPLDLPEGVDQARSLDEAIARHADEAEVFVMGGAQIYTLAWPLDGPARSGPVAGNGPRIRHQCARGGIRLRGVSAAQRVMGVMGTRHGRMHCRTSPSPRAASVALSGRAASLLCATPCRIRPGSARGGMRS